MSCLGVGLSPGKVAVYHGSDLKVVDRRVRLAELILRAAICVLALLAVVLVTTDSQVKEIFTIQKKAKFTDMKALVFLVVANGMAAAYSLVQVLRCGVSMVRGSEVFSKPLAWLIFSGDQVRFDSKLYLADCKLFLNSPMHTHPTLLCIPTQLCCALIVFM